MARRTPSPFDHSSIPTCVDDRIQLWTLYGGPPTWIPWTCGPEVFDGSSAANPLPLVDLELTAWRQLGLASRWVARYPRVPTLSVLRVRHQFPVGKTGLATFGSDFILPAAPVTLAGTLTNITTIMLEGDDPVIRFDTPVGTGDFDVTDL